MSVQEASLTRAAVQLINTWRDLGHRPSITLSRDPVPPPQGAGGGGSQLRWRCDLAAHTGATAEPGGGAKGHRGQRRRREVEGWREEEGGGGRRREEEGGAAASKAQNKIPPPALGIGAAALHCHANLCKENRISNPTEVEFWQSL